MEDVVSYLGAVLWLAVGTVAICWPQRLQKIEGRVQPKWVTFYLRVFGALSVIGSIVVLYFLNGRRRV